MGELIGRTVSHYRILRRVGAGGMGVVYLARDEHLDRDVALKVLPAGAFADEASRRHFRNEALTLSKLNHPHIETVYDFDSAEGMDFLVMEYVGGESVRDRVTRGALSAKDVIRLGIQLAQGLVAAHEHGVIHRDLKPDNLRVTPDGRLKILDFGLAKLLRGEEESTGTLTRTGPEPVTGTLPYMPPEQLSGQETDARSDIYSAGAVLYEMATGHRPFAESHGADLMAAILGRDPAPPHELRRGLVPALEAVILKAMDKNPAHRYQTARELLVDLERVSAPTSVLVVPRPVRGARARWWAVAGTALALVVLGTYVLYLRRPSDDRQPITARGRIPSVAVLYFQNLGGNPEDDTFAAGITEDLTTSLSRIEGLRVISRGSVERYRRKAADPREIGKELGVDFVLEGSIRRVNETLRVTAQLIQTSDGSHVWAQRVDGSVQNILAVHDSLASRVASALRAAGIEQALFSRRWTENAQVYALYLAARQAHLALEPGEAATDVRRSFERALALDPNYAPAMVGLADLITWEWEHGRWDWDSLQRAMSLARRAQGLDSTLAIAYRAEGRAHEVLGFVRRAETLLLRAVRTNPRIVENYYSLARIQQKLGQRDRMIETIRAGLNVDELRWHLYMTLAHAYRSWGQIDKAEATLAHGLARLPGDPDLLEVRADLLLARNRYDEALSILRSLLGSRPGRRQAHTRVMWVLREAKRQEQADSATWAVARRWNDAYILHEAGSSFLRGGRFGAAESLFRAVTRKESDFYPAWRDLAECLRMQSRAREAEETWQGTLRRWPKVSAPYVNFATELLQMRKPAEAEKLARQAAGMCPEAVSPPYCLGLIYSYLGRYDDAVTALRSAVSLRPDASYAYSQLSLTLQSLGRFDAAAAAGESAVAFKPDHAASVSNLANIYLTTGKLHRAASLYERALEMDSTKSWLYLNLGEVYRLEGQPQRALLMNLRAVELDSTMTTAMYNVALIAYSYLRDHAQVRRAATWLRRSHGASKELETSIELPAAALHFLGRVEELEGRPERARIHYSQGLQEIRSVLRVNPNAPEHLEAAAYLFGCAGDARKARQYCEKLLTLQPDAPETMVNVACALALAGETGTALGKIENAVAAGYRDKLRLSRDPDLDRIRSTSRFQKVLASIE